MKLTSKGIGLLEVVMAAGILTVVGLGFSQMMVNGMRGQDAVTSNADINNLATLIQVVMGSEPACKASLADPPGGPYIFSPIKAANPYSLGNWPTTPPNPATNAVVQIDHISFSGVTLPYPVVAKYNAMYGTEYKITKLELFILNPNGPAGSGLYAGAIHVQATKVTGMMDTGSKQFDRVVQIPLTIQTVPTGLGQQITDCPVSPPPTCPNLTQWKQVGTGGEGFCISAKATTFGVTPLFSAAAICESQSAHLCSSEEWLEACHVLGGSFDAPPQWVAPIYTGCGSPGCFDLAGGGGCLIGGAGGDGYNHPHAFRCCVR